MNARRPLLAILLVAFLVATPAAQGAITLYGKAVDSALPYAPRLHCTIVFQQTEFVYCPAYGDAERINQLRIRIVGNADVQVILDDARNAVYVPVGSAHCSQSCVVTLPGEFDSPRFAMFVFATGTPATTVQVTAEWAPVTGV